jgi:hypothetical protein
MHLAMQLQSTLTGTEVEEHTRARAVLWPCCNAHARHLSSPFSSCVLIIAQRRVGRGLHQRFE